MAMEMVMPGAQMKQAAILQTPWSRNRLLDGMKKGRKKKKKEVAQRRAKDSRTKGRPEE
jgi:hypothetical protein